MKPWQWSAVTVPSPLPNIWGTSQITLTQTSWCSRDKSPVLCKAWCGVSSGIALLRSPGLACPFEPLHLLSDFGFVDPGCCSPFLVGPLDLWAEMRGGDEMSHGATVPPVPRSPSPRYVWVQHHPSASPLFGLVDAPQSCYWNLGGSATHFGGSRNNSPFL